MPQTSGHTRQFGSWEMTMTPSTLVQKLCGWLPISLTSRALCSPSQICNVLSRFIISSDPFTKQTQFPCPSHETGLVWEQSLNCTRAEWGAVLKAGHNCIVDFFGREKRNLERACNGLEAGFANQFHNECISLWSPLLARNKIEAVFCFAEVSTFKTCSGFIISARACTSFLIHGCKIQRDRTAQKITAKDVVWHRKSQRHYVWTTWQKEKPSENKWKNQ